MRLTVNGLHYWHESMRLADQSGKSVPVRYEPFDMGFVYAYIGGPWREWNAGPVAPVPARSARGWNLILDEGRVERSRNNPQQNPTTVRPLGQLWSEQ